MMKDIKECLKLLKYGYQMKTNVACACIFVVIGIVFMVISFGDFVMGAMYIYLGIMFVTQPMYMIMFSESVAASPRRKKIEIRYVDILNVIGGVVGSTLLIVMALLTQRKDMEGASMESILVIGGMMAFIFYCYMSISFKRMIMGMILFIGSFWVISALKIVLNTSLTNVLGGKMLLAVVIFLLENALGIVCAHGIRKLLYRKSMSRLAAGAKLRMEQS